MDKISLIGKRIIEEFIDLIKIFVVCFIIVYAITNWIVKPIKVEGSSMYPTLEDHAFGFTNVFAAKFLSIDRFDVVIVHNKERDEFWIKRVIGLPNDTIEYKNDVLYINQEPVEEPYLNQSYAQNIKKESLFTEDFGPIQLKEDQYWLMGDNRVRSEDSRRHGPFQKNEIIGKDVFVFFPFQQMKYIHDGI